MQNTLSNGNPVAAHQQRSGYQPSISQPQHSFHHPQPTYNNIPQMVHNNPPQPMYNHFAQPTSSNNQQVTFANPNQAPFNQGQNAAKK